MSTALIPLNLEKIDDCGVMPSGQTQVSIKSPTDSLTTATTSLIRCLDSSTQISTLKFLRLLTFLALYPRATALLIDERFLDREWGKSWEHLIFRLLRTTN